MTWKQQEQLNTTGMYNADPFELPGLLDELQSLVQTRRFTRGQYPPQHTVVRFRYVSVAATRFTASHSNRYMLCRCYRLHRIHHFFCATSLHTICYDLLTMITRAAVDVGATECVGPTVDISSFEFTSLTIADQAVSKSSSSSDCTILSTPVLPNVSPHGYDTKLGDGNLERVNNGLWKSQPLPEFSSPLLTLSPQHAVGIVQAPPAIGWLHGRVPLEATGLTQRQKGNDIRSGSIEGQLKVARASGLSYLKLNINSSRHASRLTPCDTLS